MIIFNKLADDKSTNQGYLMIDGTILRRKVCCFNENSLFLTVGSKSNVASKYVHMICIKTTVDQGHNILRE